jgi:glycosyltransferase involved in cell wall biosynthesis
MRIPVVNAITGLGYAFTDDGWMRWLLRTVAEAGYRMALRRPGTRTIFQNADDQALFVARGLVRHEDTRVVRGSGVDLDRFAPTPEPSESHGPPVVLFAARMLWDKGVGELIDAVRMLKADGVPFRMLLAGAPDRSNPVAVPEARLRAWEAEGLVEWLGHRDDMPALLAQSNIVCLPSYYREGVPLTLIEAAACGRPIVATDAPGCREIVQHGVNGLCVAPRDPTALVEALRRLIADPALRRSMGAAGHEWVRAHFTVQRVIEQTLVVYAELVAAEGSRPGDS